MDSLRLGVLPGDGIGPEVVEAALTVLRAAVEGEPTVRLALRPLLVGWEAIRQHGVALPEATVEALHACDGWILGPHDSASYPPAEQARLNPSAALRKRFDLYANLRPARAYPGLPAVRPDLDLVIVRENTEGLYADRNMAAGSGEFMPTPDVALAVGLVTRAASERIARVAFALARTRRRRVTIVHKANVLRLTMGLFRDACRAVAADFPDVACDDYHVDAMTAHLVRRGGEFDVLVTENMLGDILSDLAGELAGSLGLAGAVNAGDVTAMAQATHGAAPDIAGQGIANPVGMIRSTALLLRWLGERRGVAALTAIAGRIEAAVARTLSAGQVRTPDLGGRATSRELAAAIAAAARRA
jgi:3-isopropylmalate dehydrogenase